MGASGICVPGSGGEGQPGRGTFGGPKGGQGMGPRRGGVGNGGSWVKPTANAGQFGL